VVKINAVFGIDIELFTKYKKLCKKYNQPHSDFEYMDGRALHVVNNGEDRFLIYLGAQNFMTVAHEASHVTTFIMDYLNIVDDEFRSYLVGYICEQVELKLT